MEREPLSSTPPPLLPAPWDGTIKDQVSTTQPLATTYIHSSPLPLLSSSSLTFVTYAQANPSGSSIGWLNFPRPSGGQNNDYNFPINFTAVCSLVLSPRSPPYYFILFIILLCAHPSAATNHLRECVHHQLVRMEQLHSRHLLPVSLSLSSFYPSPPHPLSSHSPSSLLFSFISDSHQIWLY